MLKEASKPIIKIFSAGVVAIIFGTAVAGCGDGDLAKATEIKELAQQALERGEYTDAICRIDSLDSLYRGQTDVRREGMVIRAKAIEGLTKSKIVSTDSLLASLNEEIDGLESQFAEVAPTYTGGVGYIVYKKILPSNISKSTGVEPRISADDKTMTLLVNLQANTPFNAISIGDGNEKATSSSFNESRIVKEGNSQLVSLLQEEVAPIGAWLAMRQPKKMTLYFEGTPKEMKSTLSESMIEAIQQTYKYAQALNQKNQALIMREKLERQLSIARDQIANSQTF